MSGHLHEPRFTIHVPRSTIRMLTVAGISKSYGPVRALDDVSASFAPGEIHAVLGENGAGKSTLMHVLAGFAVPDQGYVELDGRQIPPGRPAECRRLGIAMIHQHFTLVPGFTVQENLVLANLSSFGPLDPRVLARPAVNQAGNLGWVIDPQARTARLPVGAQQRVEILKNLGGDALVVIFDEPSAVLSATEVEDLFRVLKKLKDAGKIVILIAHKLREVMAVADRVTVLRQGRVVAESEIGEVTAAKLAEWMVGEMPAALHKESSQELREGLAVAGLTAKGDRGEEALRGIDFVARRGEVLGIGGVDGNGQVELAEVLAGVRPWSGSMLWEGVQLDEPRRDLRTAEGTETHRSVLWPSADSVVEDRDREEAVSNPRVAYIPQDRQTDGLALSMSIEDNLLIEGHRRRNLTRGPFIRTGAVRDWAAGLIKRFDIKALSVKDLVGSLSGGNQQKVVVARALDETQDLLIAVNPSRGLDVKATEYVSRKILEARDSGAAVVLISTDLDELAALASRTVYLSRGRIVEGEGAVALLGGSA